MNLAIVPEFWGWETRSSEWDGVGERLRDLLFLDTFILFEQGNGGSDVTCLRSHSTWVTELPFERRLAWPQRAGSFYLNRLPPNGRGNEFLQDKCLSSSLLLPQRTPLCDSLWLIISNCLKVFLSVAGKDCAFFSSLLWKPQSLWL